MIRGLFEWGKYYSSFVDADVASAYLTLPRAEARDSAACLAEALEWICHAQDATPDGGVARGYAFVYNSFFRKKGWVASYPETTGYIIPTVFDYAAKTGRSDLFDRAVRMTDWECDVQMANGAVQGGTVDEPATPAVFNTGQVIFGWVRAWKETGNRRFLDAAERAGMFLVNAQDADGAWRKSLSDYASRSMSSYTYNTRTAWALVELADATGNSTYRDAATRNVESALREQQPNGWLRNNCLQDPSQPLLHTIAYALRGILEIGIATGNRRFVEAARSAADEVLARQRPDGSLAGRFDSAWNPSVTWSCLTGNAQIGLVWGRLYQHGGGEKYAAGLRRATHFLRRVQFHGTSNRGLDGGIAGAYPFHGGYGRFEVLNWAVKFFADALMLEAAISSATAEERQPAVSRTTS